VRQITDIQPHAAKNNPAAKNFQFNKLKINKTTSSNKPNPTSAQRYRITAAP